MRDGQRVAISADMGQVLIRDLDDAVIADFKQLASHNGRSLEAELRDVLSEHRPKRRLSVEERIALSERLRAFTPPNARLHDSTPGIRADRDSR